MRREEGRDEWEEARGGKREGMSGRRHTEGRDEWEEARGGKREWMSGRRRAEGIGKG